MTFLVLVVASALDPLKLLLLVAALYFVRSWTAALLSGAAISVALWLVMRALVVVDPIGGHALNLLANIVSGLLVMALLYPLASRLRGRSNTKAAAP